MVFDNFERRFWAKQDMRKRQVFHFSIKCRHTDTRNAISSGQKKVLIFDQGYALKSKLSSVIPTSYDHARSTSSLVTQRSSQSFSLLPIIRIVTFPPRNTSGDGIDLVGGIERSSRTSNHGRLESHEKADEKYFQVLGVNFIFCLQIFFLQIFRFSPPN